MSLRIPETASLSERHHEWIRVVERIYVEQVSQGWRHKMFRLFRAVFDSNPKLSEDGGFLFNAIAENYLDAALMVIRRELDVQGGTENLRNLLLDIIEHPTVLTRARYLEQWGGDAADMANRAFDSFGPDGVPGSKQEDHIGPERVKADLAKLLDDVERLRVYAERTRAHRTPQRGIDNTITFAELHKAVDDIRTVVGKYYALLTQKIVTDWEPVAQYNTLAAFERPWLVDRDAVRRALKED